MAARPTFRALVLGDSLFIADGSKSFAPGGYDPLRDVITPAARNAGTAFRAALASLLPDHDVEVTVLARTGVSLVSRDASQMWTHTIDMNAGSFFRRAELDHGHGQYDLIYNARGFNEGKDFEFKELLMLLQTMVACIPKDVLERFMIAFPRTGGAALRKVLDDLITTIPIDRVRARVAASYDPSTPWGSNPFLDLKPALSDVSADVVAASLLLFREHLGTEVMDVEFMAKFAFRPANYDALLVALASDVGLTLDMHRGATYVFGKPPTRVPTTSRLTTVFREDIFSERMELVRNVMEEIASIHDPVHAVEAWPRADISDLTATGPEGDGVHLRDDDHVMAALTAHFKDTMAPILEECIARRKAARTT